MSFQSNGKLWHGMSSISSSPEDDAVAHRGVRQMSFARTESSAFSKLHPWQRSIPRDGITEFVALESVPCVRIADVRDFLPVDRDERFAVSLRITWNRLRRASFETELGSSSLETGIKGTDRRRMENPLLNFLKFLLILSIKNAYCRRKALVLFESDCGNLSSSVNFGNTLQCYTPLIEWT